MNATKITPLFLRNKFDQIVGLIAERIISISDYLCDIRLVTLSEWTLFLVNAGWAFSFVFYDVETSSPVFENIYSEPGWTAVFVSLFIAHLLGFTVRSIKIRRAVATFYAMNWFVWTVITLYARQSSPVWETCFSLALISIVLAVRLKNEPQFHNGC